MFNQPLIIEITDLFALVRPRHIKEWSEEVEVKAYQNANQSKLEQYELFSQSAESLIKKDPSSIDKLVAKIIDNIQIKINNIYIRYEDAYSAPNQGTGKYVMGVLLREFNIHTTAADWITEVMSLGEDVTHKVANIKDFSLFLDYDEELSQEFTVGSKVQSIDVEQLINDTDNQVFQDILRSEFDSKVHVKHNYIVDRFGMETRITMNKNPVANQLPQLDIDIVFGGQTKDQASICVKLNVHQPQIIRILKLLEYIGYYNQFQSGALTRFQRKAIKQEFADSYIRYYCDWRLNSDNKKTHKDIIASLRSKIRAIEDEYPSEKIIVLRKFASKLIDQKLEQDRSQDEISKQVQEMSKEKIGWGLFISRDRKAQEQKAIEDFKQQMEEGLNAKLMREKSELDRELQQLTDDLSKQQVLASSEDYDKMPHGYLRFRFRVSTPCLRFSFINEFEQNLFAAEIREQLVLAEIGKGITRVIFQVRELNIQDYWTGAKAFPNILETRDLAVIQQQSSHAFVFTFESNDEMTVSPFRIEIQTHKTMFIVANIPFIQEVQRSVLNALQGEQLDFSFYKDAATEKALKYIDTGKEFIESIKKGQYSHQSLDISMLLTAPVFLVPENIFKPERPCLVIDTGSIQLNSYIIGYNQSVDYRQVKLASQLYDRYEITMSKFQINILEEGLPNGLAGFNKITGQSAVKEFTGKLTFFNCLTPIHPLYPTGEIAIVIQNFELQIGVRFLDGILRINNAIIEQFDTRHEELFKSVQSKLPSEIKNDNKKEFTALIKNVQQPVGEVDGDDVFYDMIEEEVDTQKQAENELARQKSLAVEVPSDQKTNLNVYFSVEKFQILLQQDVDVHREFSQEQIEAKREDIMKIMMLHFGIEVKIDRKSDIEVNMSVFKFLIEDVQQEVKIAPHFRMILSSQIVYTQPQDGSDQISPIKGSEQIDSYNGGVAQRSLLHVIHKVEEVEFKDAVGNEIDLAKSTQNELEISILIQQSDIKVGCILSDMRFVFAVPTAQKLALVGLGLQNVFAKLEKDRVQSEKVKLSIYEEVIDHLCSQQLPVLDSQILLRRVLLNYAALQKLDVSTSQKLYTIVLQKLQNEIGVISNIKQSEVLKEEAIDMVQQESSIKKISVEAKLNNFSIWIPLQAQTDQSQILNLSFMCDLKFDQETKQLQVLSSEANPETKSKGQFSINNLEISMICMKEYLKKVKQLSIAHGSHFSTSSLLDPCCIKLILDSVSRNLFQNTGITVDVEPIKMRIGFKHIDFANVVIGEVAVTLGYVDTIQKGWQVEPAQVIVEEHKESEIKKRIKFDKYRAQRQQTISISSIKVICQSISLSLSDDTETSIDRPLFSAKFKNTQFSLKQDIRDDDAGTYILKKLQQWQKLHPKEALEQQYMDLQFFTDIEMNYYNHRSQTYEPLLEPWYIQCGVNQLAPYTQQVISIQSQRMLNINMTFGMALTVKKIKDRVLESFKQAEIMTQEGKVISAEEAEAQRVWRQNLVVSQQSFSKIMAEEDTRSGYTFQNFTGLDLRIAVHDSMKNYTQPQQQEYVLGEREIRLDGKDPQQSFFVSATEFAKQQRDIKARNNQGLIGNNEESPLAMDFKINGLKLVCDVPIEGVGIYSYRAQISNKSHDGNQDESSRGFFGYQEESKSENRIGLIINVTLEDYHKNVSVESQLLIANNHQEKEMKIFVKSSLQEDFQIRSDQRAVIKAGSIFRVPIPWIYSQQPLSLYIETSRQKQLLFKNLHDVFTDSYRNSRLSLESSKVIELVPGLNTSVDIFAYKCLPRRSDNSMPPQYVISFNPPVMISNYNFQPLEVRDPKEQKCFAQIAPKETALLTSLDLMNYKPSIDWIALDGGTLQTRQFDARDRIENDPVLERFSGQSLMMEVKKIMHQEVKDYGNFELRERIFDYTSSIQVMVYPKFMVVNKTAMEFKCESQTFWPLTNNYLNFDRDRIELSVSGYSTESIDITTIGVSGVLSLSLDSRDLVKLESLGQKEYVPSKLEFGIIITKAPTPFNKTTLITIVPRYIIVNMMKVPIIVKQKNQGGKSMKQILLKDQQHTFNFENKSSHLMMIRQAHRDEQSRIDRGGSLFGDIANDEQFWSSPFSVDDVDDFQVSYTMERPIDEKQELWYMPTHQNSFLRFARVIVTTQNDASILIVITNPTSTEYEIENTSDQDVEIAQLKEESMMKGFANKMTGNDDLIIGRFRRLKSQVTIPYAWQDRLIQSKRLGLRVCGFIHEVDIDKAVQKQEITVEQQGKKRVFNVEVLATGNAKRVRISNADQFSLKVPKFQLHTLLKKLQSQQLAFSIDIRGLSLSFVDEVPQELLLLTLYELKVRFSQWYESLEERPGHFENMSKFKFQMQHLQLDNMNNQIMPVILAPKKPLLNKKDYQGSTLLLANQAKPYEESKTTVKEDEAPFIQLIVIIAENEREQTKRVVSIQLAIQEFMFQLESSIINSNLKFAVELLQTFTGESLSPYLIAKKESFQNSKMLRREDICDQLDAGKSLIEQTEEIHAKKIFIEIMQLGAIKANITFKLEKKAVELDVSDPIRGFGFLNLLYTLLSGVASISNSPLTFKELQMINVFTSQDMVVKQITKYYTSSAIMQFYKIIGSSDMIGNPFGLVCKLGTGVKEFVTEPAQGLLRGPDEFVGGIGKGVQSLVGNVFSGGLDSLSKITGSLYSVVKNVSGEKNVQIQKSENIGQGIMHGVTGGVSELVGGFTGIFSKPIQKTKEEGAKGFFKGLGSGLVGAIASPFGAALRAGSSITQGAAATATSIQNYGKISVQVDANSLYSRFRPPRYINSRNVITVYDLDLAIVNQIMQQCSNGKFSQNQTILSYVTLQETRATGEVENRDLNASILIITDQMLLYLKIERDGPLSGKPTLIYKSKLSKIVRCELTQIGNKRIGIVNNLKVSSYSQSRGLQSYIFQSLDYSKLEKISSLLSSLPQCQKQGA